MKRFLFVIVLSLAVNLYAQSFKAYCSVRYNSLDRTVLVTVGQAEIPIVDTNNKPKRFNNIVDVFNYMGKKGWTIVPMSMEDANYGIGPLFLFTKTVASEIALNKEFQMKE